MFSPAAWTRRARPRRRPRRAPPPAAAPPPRAATDGAARASLVAGRARLVNNNRGAVPAAVHLGHADDAVVAPPGLTARPSPPAPPPPATSAPPPPAAAARLPRPSCRARPRCRARRPRRPRRRRRVAAVRDLLDEVGTAERQCAESPGRGSRKFSRHSWQWHTSPPVIATSEAAEPISPPTGGQRGVAPASPARGGDPRLSTPTPRRRLLYKSSGIKPRPLANLDAGRRRRAPRVRGAGAGSPARASAPPAQARCRRRGRTCSARSSRRSLTTVARRAPVLPDAARPRRRRRRRRMAVAPAVGRFVVHSPVALDAPLAAAPKRSGP